MQDAQDRKKKKGGKFEPKAKFAGVFFLCMSFWLINGKCATKIPASSRAHGTNSKQNYLHCNTDLTAKENQNETWRDEFWPRVGRQHVSANFSNTFQATDYNNPKTVSWFHTVPSNADIRRCVKGAFDTGLGLYILCSESLQNDKYIITG